MSDATQPPVATGSLAKTPFSHLILYLYQRRVSGTLIATLPKQRVLKVLFHRGRAVAAHLPEPTAALEQGLQPLAAASEGDFEFHEADLVGSGSAIVTGMFDPFAFVANATRRYAREEIVAELLGRYQDVPLALDGSMDLTRLSLTADEARFAAPLSRGPTTLEALCAQQLLPLSAARRVVYTLLITRVAVPHQAAPNESQRTPAETGQSPARGSDRARPSRGMTERLRPSGDAWRAIASRAGEMAESRAPGEPSARSMRPRENSQPVAAATPARTGSSGASRENSQPLAAGTPARTGSSGTSRENSQPLAAGTPARTGSSGASRENSQPLAAGTPARTGSSSASREDSQPMAGARPARASNPGASRENTQPVAAVPPARTGNPGVSRENSQPVAAARPARTSNRGVSRENTQPMAAARPARPGSAGGDSASRLVEAPLEAPKPESDSRPLRRAPSRPLTPGLLGAPGSNPVSRPISRPLTPSPYNDGAPRDSSTETRASSPRPSMPDVSTLDAAGKLKRVELLCQRNAYDDALPIMRVLVEEDRKSAKYLGLLAHVLLGRATGNATIGKEIIDAVNQALRIDADQVDALYTKARCYKRLGKEREALHYFRRTIAVDPNHLDATREARLLVLRMSEKRKR